jgi:hypothetical protein
MFTMISIVQDKQMVKDLAGNGATHPFSTNNSSSLQMAKPAVKVQLRASLIV